MTRRWPAATLILTLFVHVAVPGLVETGRVLCIADGHVAEEPASSDCCGEPAQDPCSSDCVDTPIADMLDAAERSAPLDVTVIEVELPDHLAQPAPVEVGPAPALERLVDPPRSHLSTVVLRL